MFSPFDPHQQRITGNVPGPKLKVINLWAGPGAGKSTTAAGLFAMMKNLQMSVELVTEVAKDATWEKHAAFLRNQLLVLAHQDQRLRRLWGQVEWAITDSPLPIGLLYAGDEFSTWLPSAVRGAWDTYENFNFFVRRVKPYQAQGRNQNEAQARSLDDEAYEACDKWCRKGNWETIPGDYYAPYAIAGTLGFTAGVRGYSGA